MQRDGVQTNELQVLMNRLNKERKNVSLVYVNEILPTLDFSEWKERDKINEFLLLSKTSICSKGNNKNYTIKKSVHSFHIRRSINESC